MDAEPVAIPADLPAAQAWEEFFLRYYGWPWFAVVEPDGRFAGLAHRAAVEHAATTEPSTPVRDIAAGADDRVRDDAPLEALLGSEPLRRLGALMAVDAEGRLRGVVTVEQVTRALRSRRSAARSLAPDRRARRPPASPNPAQSFTASSAPRDPRDRLEVVLGHARGDPHRLRLLPQLVVHERAAHRDRLPGPARQDHRRRLEPADDRHQGVEHDDVGIDLIDRLECRPDPVRLPGHDDVHGPIGVVDDRADEKPHVRMVVDDHQAHRHGGSTVEDA